MKLASGGVTRSDAKMLDFEVKSFAFRAYLEVHG